MRDHQAQHTNETPRRTVRVVSARPFPAPHDPDAVVSFHRRLTVLHGTDPDLGTWAAALLLDPAADTQVALDAQPAISARELPVEVRSRPVQVVTESTLGALLARAVAATLADVERASAEIERDLEELRARQVDASSRVGDLHFRLARTKAAALDIDLTGGTDIEATALADELIAIDADVAAARPRAVVERELAKWQRVTEEAFARLAHCRDHAPRVEPADLAEAVRLRNEWRYAEQVHRQLRRRRTRRDVEEHKQRFEEFLARFGALTYEDLAVVGTGFGNTESDLAIREAATVVSMAEQQCIALRAELDAPDVVELESRRSVVLERATTLLGREASDDLVRELRALGTSTAILVRESGPVGSDDAAALLGARDRTVDELERLGIEMLALEQEHRRLARTRQELAGGADRVGSLGPFALEALLDGSLELADATVVTPLVFDRVFAALSPTARKRAFDVLVAHSNQRQVVVIDDADDVVGWARALGDTGAIVCRRRTEA